MFDSFYRMREFGIFNYLKRKWIKEVPGPSKIHNVNSIGLEEINTIFAAYAIGTVVALIILCIEVVNFRYQTRYK